MLAPAALLISAAELRLRFGLGDMGCDGLDVDGFNVGKVSGVGSSAEGSSSTTGGVDREEATTAE